MPLKTIIEQTIQDAANRARQEGLRVCPEANEIVNEDKSYAQVAKSIWKRLECENEYIICLCAEDYREGSLRNPADWGWKVPGILAFHLGIKIEERCKNILYGAVAGTDFYLFRIVLE